MLGELGRHALKRLIALIPVLFGVSLIVFVLTAISLGDPVRAMMGQRGDPEVIAQIGKDYALDEPLWTRYGLWMGKLLRGDLGQSYHQQRPVSEVIAERFPATLRLAVGAMLIAVLLGMSAGAFAALRRGHALDHLLMGAAVLGISTP